MDNRVSSRTWEWSTGSEVWKGGWAIGSQVGPVALVAGSQAGPRFGSEMADNTW